jgi:hypothetical protein
VAIQLHIANEANKGDEYVPSQANPGYDLNPHGNFMARLETYCRVWLDFDISFTLYFSDFAVENGTRKHCGSTRPHYKACLGKKLGIKLSRTRLRHLRLKAMGQMSQRRPDMYPVHGYQSLWKRRIHTT